MHRAFNISDLWFLVILIRGITVPYGASAQPTNLEIIGRLTSACASENIEHTDTLWIATTGEYPALDLMVGSHIDSIVQKVYVEKLADHPGFVYTLNEVHIDYAKQGRRQITRRINVDVAYQSLGRSGEITNSGTCARNFEDVVLRADVASLENPAIPFSMGTLPRRSWIRRNIEPIVVVAAAGVSTILLFSLRSPGN